MMYRLNRGFAVRNPYVQTCSNNIYLSHEPSTLPPQLLPVPVQTSNALAYAWITPSITFNFVSADSRITTIRNQ